MTARPTFILGVGAQKAGTTWLHRNLCSMPEFAKPAMKEFHVWDAIYAIDGVRSVDLEGTRIEARQALRQRMIAEPELYFSYFADLMKSDGKSLTADITPSYSGLPAAAFARIRAGFVALGIVVKVVFIIRDPVERAWSAFRMYQSKQRRFWESLPDYSDHDDLLAHARSEHAQRRGRYDLTIETLESVFDPDDISVVIFEDLFEAHTVEALSSFIDRPMKKVDLETVHNASPKEAMLPPETADAIREAYHPTLQFCRERYPRTADLWDSLRA